MDQAGQREEVMEWVKIRFQLRAVDGSGYIEQLWGYVPRVGDRVILERELARDGEGDPITEDVGGVVHDVTWSEYGRYVLIRLV